MFLKNFAVGSRQDVQLSGAFKHLVKRTALPLMQHRFGQASLHASNWQIAPVGLQRWHSHQKVLLLNNVNSHTASHSRIGKNLKPKTTPELYVSNNTPVTSDSKIRNSRKRIPIETVRKLLFIDGTPASRTFMSNSQLLHDKPTIPTNVSVSKDSTSTQGSTSGYKRKLF